MARANTREVLDIYPLTPAQQGILAETLGSAGASAYLQHHELEISGTSDPEMLAGAFADLIARHDALRTAFVWDVSDQPLQVVRARAPVALTIDDLRGAAAQVIAERAAQLMSEERASPFDLTLPPLLRARAMRTGDDSWRLITTHHHLVLDGWSVSVLHTELAECLAARAGTLAPRLAPTRPFREFVTWQRQARDPAAEQTYFAGLLGGVSTGTPLGDDLPTAARLDGRAGDRDSAQPVTVFSAVAAGSHPSVAARRAGVLPSTLVHAAWALLLARWSGGEDVVFGTSVSGRPGELDGAEQRIGMFLNTAVLRIPVPGRAAVGPWLRDVQGCLDRSRPHEHAPVAAAQRCSAAPPGTSLLTSVLAFQNYWRPDHGDITAAGTSDDHGGIIRVRVLSRSERTGLPVTAAVALPVEGVWVRLGYDPARVSGAAARRAAHAFASLVARLALLDENTALADIPVTTGPPPAPRHEPPAAGLMTTIAARLSGNSAGLAVTAADGTATGADLLAAAGRTASGLRPLLPQTSGPGAASGAGTVSICAPPGLALVTGLLAALAGGAIAALADPCLPAPELSARLSGTPVLVPAGTVLAAEVASPVLGIAGPPTAPGSRDTGSEGTGSGAAGGHSQLAALAFGADLVCDALRLTADDAVLAVLAPEDPVLPSVILAALAAGCRLELRDPADGEAAVPASTPRSQPAARQPQVGPTVLVAAAPAACALLPLTAPAARVALAGEPPMPEQVRRVLAAGRTAWRLWACGRTGGADACTRLRDPADALLLGRLPGGMVADEAGLPVPPGRSGELVIVRPAGSCRAGIKVRQASSDGMAAADHDQVVLEQLGRTAADELVFTGHLLGLDAGIAAAVVTTDPLHRPHGWLVPASGEDPWDPTEAARGRAAVLPARAQPADYTVLAQLPVARDGGTDICALAASLRPARRPASPALPDPVSSRLAALPRQARDEWVSRLRSLAQRTPGLRHAADAQARSQQQEEWCAQAAAAPPHSARTRAELPLPAKSAPARAGLASALAGLRLPPTTTGFADESTEAVTLTADPEWLDVASLAMVADWAASGQAPVPAFSYADYADWQNSDMRAAAREDHAAYWRTVLTDAEPARWPAPFPASAAVGQAGQADSPAEPPATAVTRLPMAAEEEVWIAAAATALAFLSGTEDVLFGVVTRPDLPAETAAIPGAYARTLPLRVTVDAGQPFGFTVASAARALRDARAHGDVNWAVMDRLLPRPLALSVAVAAQPGALAAHGSAAIALDISPGAAATAAGPPETVLTAAQAPGRAHPGDVRRLLELTGAVAQAGGFDPDRGLHPADLTSDPALTELRRLGDGGPADPDYPATIWNAVLARVQADPDATAVEAPDGVLSYRELASRATALASKLRELDIGWEDRVAVCLPRQLAMVWAPLGIMVAGAAYLPLDPDHPAERHQLVLADAGASAVVTTAELAGRWPAGLPVLVVGTGDGSPSTAMDPAAKRGGPAAATTAYVLYTSGSMGKPKGVVIEHRALAAFCAHIARAYHIDAGTRLLAFAALTFDVSVFELWAGLAAGATVVLADRSERQSPEALQRLLAEKRVTAAELPPSLMPLLDPGRLSDLRLVSVGGEAPAGSLVDSWATGEREFWNGYGPTETTVAVTLMRCHPPSGGRVPPIGLPMAGHRAYVLDESGRPVPAGVPGELCIAGCGLARGYLGLPGQTAASFVPDPAGPPGARMYRTGDLARWTAEGVLEFLGRADRQVKIRGFRVEPAEVEAALAGHPAVRQVTVQPWDAPDGTRHLAAYVVPASDADPPTLADLRAAATLPGYMLPTRLAVLAELPLTPAGKVDRQALPAPAGAQTVSDMTGWTPAERVLAQEVIGPLIGVQSPGREDGFFEMGGNSIQAAQVTARVRDRFGADISLVDFFREPTVAGLAKLVDRGRPVPAQQPVAGLRMTDGATLPLSFPQATLYAAYRASGDLPGYHAPLALRLRGPLDLDALRAAFGWLTTRHAPLRATFTAGPGDPVQFVHPPTDPSFTISDVPAGAPAVRDKLLRQAVGAEAERPFDLACGPLLRVRVHRFGEADHVVQWTIHHVATDGWSTSVQLHELGAAYHAFAAGGRLGQPALPPLEADYGDFIAWHRGYVASADFRDDLAWWRRALAGAAVDQRPARTPGAVSPPFRHGWRNLRLPGETADLVRDFTRARGVTLFMTCLAAQAAVISAETGSDDVLVITPYALRVRSVWEDLVGWFANPVAVRLRVPAATTFAELTLRAREACLAAFSHGYVPFELLRSELALEAPTLATQLSVLNAPGRTFGFRGFGVDVVGDDSGRDFIPVMEVYSPPGTRFQFSIVLRERVGGVIAGGLEYDAAAVDSATADRWHAAFLAILAAGTAAPDTRVARLIRLAHDRPVQVSGESAVLLTRDAGPGAGSGR